MSIKKINKLNGSFKKINFYYNDLLSINTIVTKKIYSISYPIFYKETYYFLLIGKTIKIVNRNLKLNTIIKFLSSIDNKKFIINIPLQLPYLLY